MVITGRTRNALASLLGHEGSNPFVSAFFKPGLTPWFFCIDKHIFPKNTYSNLTKDNYFIKIFFGSEFEERTGIFYGILCFTCDCGQI